MIHTAATDCQINKVRNLFKIYDLNLSLHPSNEINFGNREKTNINRQEEFSSTDVCNSSILFSKTKVHSIRRNCETVRESLFFGQF